MFDDEHHETTAKKFLRKVKTFRKSWGIYSFYTNGNSFNFIGQLDFAFNFLDYWGEKVKSDWKDKNHNENIVLISSKKHT